MHKTFSFTTTVDYKPASEKDLAGIVALQSERYNYVFGITKKGADYYILLERTSGKFRSREVESKIVAKAKIDISKPVRLQVTDNGDDYQFSYSTLGTGFVNMFGTVSGDILSTDVAGGFTGCLLGLYATSANNAVPE
jgi:alpha-N-arabinofuranosidase